MQNTIQAQKVRNYFVVLVYTNMVAKAPYGKLTLNLNN